MIPVPTHLRLSRRTALQAGSVGLLGLGMNHVAELRSEAAGPTVGEKVRKGRAKSVIFVFLSGGLTQHESFDPKPKAPQVIRGDFDPISTSTPGFQIC